MDSRTSIDFMVEIAMEIIICAVDGDSVRLWREGLQQKRDVCGELGAG